MKPQPSCESLSTEVDAVQSARELVSSWAAEAARISDELLEQERMEQREHELGRHMLFWGTIGAGGGLVSGAVLFGGMGAALLGSSLFTVVGIGIGAVTAHTSKREGQ